MNVIFNGLEVRRCQDVGGVRENPLFFDLPRAHAR